MSPTSHAPPMKDVLSSRQTPDGKERHGFFSKQLKGARKEWAKLTFLVCAALGGGVTTHDRHSGSSVFSCSSSCQSTLVRPAFWFTTPELTTGSYYLQIDRADHFTVEFIDLDSEASPDGSTHAAVLGPAMYTAIVDSVQSRPHLGWFATDDTTMQSFQITQQGRGRSAFDYATKRVTDQDVWGVVIVNANATSGVWNAITTGSQWDRESTSYGTQCRMVVRA